MKKIFILGFLLFMLGITPNLGFSLTYDLKDVYITPNGDPCAIGNGFWGGDGDWNSGLNDQIDWSIGSSVPFDPNCAPSNDMIFSTNEGDDFYKANAWKERMRITKDGNVGIGTMEPLSKFDIRGSLFIDAGIPSPTWPGEGGRIRMEHDYFDGVELWRDALIIEKTEDDMTAEGGIIFGFATSPNTNTLPQDPGWATIHQPVMAIRGSGNVGIGTTSPGYALDVVGAIGGSHFVVHNPNNQGANVWLNWLDDVARIRVAGNGAGAGNGFDIQGPGDTSLIRITGSGNVGIGTTSPNAKLEVNGNAIISNMAGTGNAYACVNSSGGLYRSATACN